MTTLNSVDENSTTINTSNPSSPVKVIKKTTRIIDTDYGYVNVYVHGDLKEKEKRAIFLTVHDIGTNHLSFEDFVQNLCMSEIASRSIFIHIDLPGQENGASLYEGSYPSLQELGENLIPRILDDLKVPLVVGIGEGAGANILARFALRHPHRCLGLVLIHFVSSGVGMLEKLKETFQSGKRRPSEAFQAPESVIALHRFGKIGEEHTEINSRVSNIHPLNLRKYIEAYMNRKDISEKLSTTKIDCLLIAGAKSPYATGVSQLYSKMDKSRTSFVKFDDVVDILNEAPKKLAESMLLFVKGLGFLTSLSLSGLDRQRSLSNASQSSGDSPGASSKAALGAIGRRRTLSMEDYDQPRPRRLSFTAGQQNGNIAANASASPQK